MDTQTFIGALAGYLLMMTAFCGEPRPDRHLPCRTLRHEGSIFRPFDQLYALRRAGERTDADYHDLALVATGAGSSVAWYMIGTAALSGVALLALRKACRGRASRPLGAYFRVNHKDPSECTRRLTSFGSIGSSGALQASLPNPHRIVQIRLYCRGQGTISAGCNLGNPFDQQREHEMADLVVKLSRDLSHSVLTSGSIKDGDIAHTLQSFDARLAMPTDAAGESAQFFRVDGVEPEKIEQLRQKLEGLNGIEAAYIKPSDALP